MEPEWVFPSHEIQITEAILGRGAYGEVRVGKWRNIEVACKRLHTVSGSEVDARAMIDGLQQEMAILSKLRHPNLVLFLGVCTDRAADNTAVVPTVILTELMPCSLYDILEVHKVELSLAEIIDISLDIAHGLQYLHSHIPPIVHRDISSKNILIGGNKAKIADLGQAKIFGSTLMSRQTSMPGAMAYSAPEVLTGKYTAKIDVFSFGVLLIQLSTGQYPRIEKREEQLEQSCAKYPPLAQMMTSCVAFHPDSRPTTVEICAALNAVKSNDRFYPAARRLPPLSDLGVM
jgi:serine/threonine protein kinase